MPAYDRYPRRPAFKREIRIRNASGRIAAIPSILGAKQPIPEAENDLEVLIGRQGTCFLVFGTGIHGMGKREELYGTHQRRHSTGDCRWPPNSNGDIPHHFSTTVAYRLRKSTVCVRSLSCNSVSDGGVP